jgi:lipoprotein-anchoring transpeptidase ErfK/SrfK
MRLARLTLAVAVAAACGLCVSADSVFAATTARGHLCAPGSVRWLERWDVAYAGRVMRPVTVHRRPGGPAFMSLGTNDRYGFWTVVPIVAERLDRACKPTWFRVRVTHYPNGTLGWIRAGTVATSRIRRRIVIDVSRRRLFLYQRGKLILSTPAAVGKASTPTPLGRFYITQRFIVTARNSPFGTRALGISAFSNVLRSWVDGGPVGIHGTNEHFSIGKGVSHGCVRLPEQTMRRLFGLVPLATPVIVRG